ncbi:enoyl-CoA hydratase [Williamsia sp. MIQD14]|uniref:enoyl-CoA hydratase n=1 Tax=Williamsia sp. MIQD14 TaxID=3425703 RepID=UPI003DA11E23
MRTRFRSLIAAVAVTAATLTGGVIAAVPASAAPPKDIPKISQYSDNIGAFGDHDFCRGAFNVRLSSPKRGVTRVTLTSFGFTGNGRGWAKNPKCKLLIGTTFTSAKAFDRQSFFPVVFGTRPGEKVTRDFATGSGLVQLGVAPYAANNPVRVLQGYGASFYFIAP